MRDGDFSVRLAGDQTGLAGKIADTFNEIVTSNERLAGELERAGQIVGKDGKTRHRMSSDRRSGAWGAMETSVNTLIEDLLWPITEVTRAISSVAKGDLQQTMSLEVSGRPLKGEFLRSASIVNTMIEQMSAFTSEVTRVAREVGTEGKLGGQAAVPGVAGTWKDLDRLGQLHGQQPHRPGAQHLRGDHRGGERRSVAQDHRRRARRDPAAEGGHQHHGRSAALGSPPR